MILVTGATGHIGNVLVRKLLDRGEKVRALIWHGEDTSPIHGLDVEQVDGDVLDPVSLASAMQGVDTVYHLAGIISIMPGKIPFVWRVNVEGTRNVLEAARHAHIRRLVYTSSIHAIARAPHGVTQDESLGFD
jgi:dihydroflavonol-4-reductase